MPRPNKDTYYMTMAHVASLRATCPRLRVGCIIVSASDEIVGTGYNGSPAGQPHCDEVGCLLNGEGRCIRTVHAEENAVTRCHQRFSLRGATAYVTHEPCERCARMLLNMGIARVVYDKAYKNEYSSYFLEKMQTAQVAPSTSFSLENSSYQGKSIQNPEAIMTIYAIVNETPTGSRTVQFARTKPVGSKMYTASRRAKSFKSGETKTVYLYKVKVLTTREHRDSVIATLNALQSPEIPQSGTLQLELLAKAESQAQA